MRKKLFDWLSKTIVRHNTAVLVFCALFTLAMIFASFRIKMKTQFSDMLPAGIPQIDEFEKIVEDYKSISTIMVVVESDSAKTDRMKQAAEDVVANLKDLYLVKPKEDQNLTVGQRLGVFIKDKPADNSAMKFLHSHFSDSGVAYDTIRLVRRIDYKADKDFLMRHGMIIQKPKDLKNMTGMFGSLELAGLLKNINDNFEKEYVEDADNLNSLDGEAQAVQGLEGVYKFVSAMGEYVDDKNEARVKEAVSAFVSGPDYFISSDNTLLLIMLQPSLDWEQFDDMMALGYQVVDSLKAIDARYPDLYVAASGSAVLQIDEMEATKKDFGWPSVIALALILLLLIGSFRTWKNPFYSVVVLVVGVIWAAGVLGLVLEFLNMMSAAFGIILIGLGIDFGIHFISGFKDGRESGLSVPDAVSYMYHKVGAGVITGGSTTAVVFFALALARFKTYTEMGIAIGLGIVMAMVAFFVLLPALLVFDNKGYSVTGNLFRKIKLGFVPSLFSGLTGPLYAFFNLAPFRGISEIVQFRYLGALGGFVGRIPVAAAVILFAAVTVILSVNGATHLGFEYDMMKLEPKGIPTVIVQDKILEKFEIAPDYAMLLADNLEDCREKIEQLKKVGNRTDLIGGVDGITEFLAPEARQRGNVKTIEAFRKKVEAMPVPGRFLEKDLEALNKELVRLHQNIVEIGELSIAGQGEKNKITRKCDKITGKRDEDSKILALTAKLAGKAGALSAFQKITAQVLKARLLNMTSTEIVTMDNLPEDIKTRYVNPNNQKLLVTIYPKSQIWESRNLRKFNEAALKVSARTTGMPIIFLILIDFMKQKGLLALLIGAGAIIFFLLLDFRSFKLMALAALPLFVGAAWMVGLQAFFGWKFDMMNFMALPLIIGIGIDDGVHILHRYEIEGKASLTLVMRTTGRAVTLTTLTTMIAFGSWALASHRGMASMGRTLFMGVGTCFLSSIFLLPAIITIMEKFNGKKVS